MHHIGQILNHTDRREFQSRGAEHPNAAVPVKDAPKIDDNEVSEVEEFIDLDELTDAECKTELRFYRSDVYRLAEVLQIPE